MDRRAESKHGTTLNENLLTRYIEKLKEQQVLTVSMKINASDTECMKLLDKFNFTKEDEIIRMTTFLPKM